MYRCQVCKRRTEDIDSPPCIDKGHQFKPQQITTFHKFIREKNGSMTVLCTGKPPKSGTQGLGGNYGINCIRCKTKMKELLEAGNNSFLSRDNGTSLDLSVPPDPDTLSHTSLPS
jgi:hypothetical protein